MQRDLHVRYIQLSLTTSISSSPAHFLADFLYLIGELLSLHPEHFHKLTDNSLIM